MFSRYPSANEERTALSSSVRDLLLLNPIDPSLRIEVSEKVAKRKAILTSQKVEQLRQDKTPLDWDYIPENSPDHAKQLAIRVYGVLRRKNRVLIQNLLTEVQRAAEADPDEPLIRRVFGHLLISLGDHIRGNQFLFDAAVKLTPRDPAAAYDLADRLLNSQDLQQAHELADWLIENNWGEIAKSSVEHVRNIYRVYWLSLMWLGEVEKVIEGTKDWYEAEDLATNLGSYHASALRRSAENEPSAIAEPLLLKSIRTMNMLFELDGITGIFANEGIKLIDDIVRNTLYWGHLSPTLAFESCQFVNNHLLTLVSVHRDYTEDDPEVSKWITILAKCDCDKQDNPLNQEIWSRFLRDGVYIKDEEYELINIGYDIVNIYSRPNYSNNFLFAKNDSGEEFYVHRDNLNGNDITWRGLKIGDRLAIIRGNVLDRDKAIPVREAKIVK